MGRYTVTFSGRADKDLQYWQKTGDKSILRKIEKIVDELTEHPTTGIGNAERLKGDLSGYWSSRLNRKDRVVYKIEDAIVTVYVLSLRGHYGDS
jgi:toxin YoeB